jgi:dihydrofolate synthase / folylpolyglutamate synthase
MEYKKVLEELYSLENIKFMQSLGNMKILLKLLGNPENHLKFIHVAGTNGKGSVCAMIQSILMEAGYVVGMYTSPHLKRFNERIRINDNLITDKDIVDYYQEIKKKVTNQTFFEVTTAMAFLYFNEKKVDFAVIEAGLGGRLDSTNVIMPLISIITNVGKDHTEYLGTNITRIAKEKAGIIKNKVPVVTAARGISLDVIKKIADKEKSKIYVVRQANKKINLKNLRGKFQVLNSNTALKAISVLHDAYNLKISEDKIKIGLSNTNWPGRFQFLEKNVIIDCAHNPSGIAALVDALKEIQYGKLIIVAGFSKDKDIKSISKILKNQYHQIILTKSENFKAADPQKIKKYFNKATIKPNLIDAMKYAKGLSKSNDLILVTGSIYLVGKLL